MNTKNKEFKNTGKKKSQIKNSLRKKQRYQSFGFIVGEYQ